MTDLSDQQQLADFRMTNKVRFVTAASLFDAVRSGRVKIDIGQRFPLSKAAEAHRALEARETTGSTVLTIG